MSRKVKIHGDVHETKTSALKIEARPGGWMIATDDNGQRIRFSVARKGTRFFYQSQGQHGGGEWMQAGGSAAASGNAGESVLTAQFPGKVRKILQAIGAQVNEGDGLVVVEAMKMEFTIQAPYAGKISKINCQDGQQIEPGLKLVEIEKSS